VLESPGCFYSRPLQKVRNMQLLKITLFFCYFLQPACLIGAKLEGPLERREIAETEDFDALVEATISPTTRLFEAIIAEDNARVDDLIAQATVEGKLQTSLDGACFYGLSSKPIPLINSVIMHILKTGDKPSKALVGILEKVINAGITLHKATCYFPSACALIFAANSVFPIGETIHELVARKERERLFASPHTSSRD
jgi:hypothetical protein